MMALRRACFEPFLQREMNTSSSGHTPGMRAHVPWLPLGWRGHVVRGAACADRRLGSRLFFASCLREYAFACDLRHGEYVLPRAATIGGVRTCREGGAGRWSGQTSPPGSHPATDSYCPDP